MNTWSKRGICIFLALCMMFGGLGITAFAESRATPPIIHPFPDVWPHTWYTSAALEMHERNIMLGIRPATAPSHAFWTYFLPSADMTRAMAVATLFRMEHGRVANSEDSRDNPFYDVPENAWFTPYVSWAYQNDIINGASEMYFAPRNPVTREAFVTMLHRYAQPDFVSGGGMVHFFPDAPQRSSWANDGLNWAIARGLLRGNGGRLNAQEVASRAECAVILQRFIAQYPIGSVES